MSAGGVCHACRKNVHRCWGADKSDHIRDCTWKLFRLQSSSAPSRSLFDSRLLASFISSCIAVMHSLPFFFSVFPSSPTSLPLCVSTGAAPTLLEGATWPMTLQLQHGMLSRWRIMHGTCVRGFLLFPTAFDKQKLQALNVMHTATAKAADSPYCDTLWIRNR